MKSIDVLLSELYNFSKDIITLNEPLKDFIIVENFERERNLKLPNDYKYLLSKHDGIDLMGVTIYGFTGVENVDTVYNFEHHEVVFPQFDYLMPFSPDGGGNFYCFDTRECDNNNSCSIVFWTSNYEYKEDDQPEQTNLSFSEWMEEVMLDWTLENYSYDGSEKF